VNDARRERIAAAGDVFERVLRGYEGAPPTAPSNGHASGTERVQLAQLRTAAARTVDLYSHLVQEALEAVVHAVEDVVPGLGGAGEAALALAGPPGAVVCAPVWIHNSTDGLVRGVEL
jgi:hypothetical protein